MKSCHERFVCVKSCQERFLLKSPQVPRFTETTAAYVAISLSQSRRQYKFLFWLHKGSIWHSCYVWDMTQLLTQQTTETSWIPHPIWGYLRGIRTDIALSLVYLYGLGPRLHMWWFSGLDLWSGTQMTYNHKKRYLFCIGVLDTIHPLISCTTEIIHLDGSTPNHYLRALYADSRFWFESEWIFSLELQKFGWR